MNNAENPKERDRTSQLISSLDPNFIISTMFLADLMYILTKMIKMFQRDHIDLSAIKAQFIGTEFPDSEIYNALRIFDPKFLPQRESDIANYGNNEIKILIEYFGNDQLSATGEKFSAYVNETELKQKWGIVKQIMKSIHNFDFVKGLLN
ncbi:unnamed protein product [Rhizophagus irregularis]|nr:unnamed protein product [Rhizophagus irregularis]